MPYQLTDNDVRDLRRMRRKLDGMRGPGVTNQPESITINPPLAANRGGRGGSFDAIRLRIKTVYTDYYSCVTWDGTTEGTDPILVAKPFKCRQTLANYPGLTSIATLGTQSMTATNGATSETWTIYPLAYANDEIWAITTPGTGVTVDDAELTWLDSNVDARKWNFPT